MDLSVSEKKIIVDLIKLAWDSGAVRSPELSDALNVLKAKLV